MMKLSYILLPTKVGRKVLRNVLESGPIDQSKIDMLTTVANALGEGEAVANGIKDILKTRNATIEEKLGAAKMMNQ